MPFAGRTSAAPPHPTNVGNPPPPPPQNTGNAGSPPPPPPPPATSRLLWVSLNGQTTQKTEAEAKALPPATPAMFQDDPAGGWKTIQQLFAGQVQQQANKPAFGAPGQPSQPTGGAMTPRGLFAGVENAQVSRRGANLEQGDYVAKLLSAEYKRGRNGDYIILEMNCLVSSYDPNDPIRSKCNQEGTTFTIFIKKNDSFLGNMKEVILALSGLDEHGKPRPEDDTVSQQECEALVSPEQPYSGAIVYLEARGIITRSNQPFTRINWWPCPIKADGSPDLDNILKVRGA